MTEENGSSECYRPRFTLPVAEILIKWAGLESRSVPSLIQDLVVEAIVHRITAQNLSLFKKRVIIGEEKV